MYIKSGVSIMCMCTAMEALIWAPLTDPRFIPLGTQVCFGEKLEIAAYDKCPPSETLTSLENVAEWGKHLVIQSCEYVPDREPRAS